MQKVFVRTKISKKKWSPLNWSFKGVHTAKILLTKTSFKDFFSVFKPVCADLKGQSSAGPLTIGDDDSVRLNLNRRLSFLNMSAILNSSLFISFTMFYFCNIACFYHVSFKIVVAFRGSCDGFYALWNNSSFSFSITKVSTFIVPFRS